MSQGQIIANLKAVNSVSHDPDLIGEVIRIIMMMHIIVERSLVVREFRHLDFKVFVRILKF